MIFSSLYTSHRLGIFTILKFLSQTIIILIKDGLLLFIWPNSAYNGKYDKTGFKNSYKKLPMLVSFIFLKVRHNILKAGLLIITKGGF